MKTKTISLGYSKRRGSATSVKIETPGGTVTVTTNLTAANGRERIRVDVEANGSRFAGEPRWWYIPGDGGVNGSCGWIEKEVTHDAD